MSMNYEELQEHIRYLESIRESDAPIVNCYLGVKSPYREVFNEQCRSITAGLPLVLRASFWEVLGHIEVFLGTGLFPETKGVAIFTRWGGEPFFLPLQLDAPFSNSIVIRPVPQIQPLVQMRDAMVCAPGNSSAIFNSAQGIR